MENDASSASRNLRRRNKNCKYEPNWGNTGTYVDAPIHRYRRSADLTQYPLEKLAHMETVIIDTTAAISRGIGSEFRW